MIFIASIASFIFGFIFATDIIKINNRGQNMLIKKHEELLRSIFSSLKMHTESIGILILLTKEQNIKDHLTTLKGQLDKLYNVLTINEKLKL